MPKIKEILNRNNEIEEFDISEIAYSLYLAGDSIDGFRSEIDRFPKEVQETIFKEYLDCDDYTISEKLAEKVVNKLEENNITVPKVNTILDYCEKVLLNEGFIRTGEHFIPYRRGRDLVRENRITDSQFMWDGLPQNPSNPIRRLFIESGEYNFKNKILTVKQLNELFKDKEKLKTIIEEYDNRYEQSIEDAVKAFLDKNSKHPIKLIKIAGPSSSAKTTTTKNFINKLIESEKEFKDLIIPLAGDDYFKSLKDIEEDIWEDINYEVPDAMLFDRFVKNIEDCIDGKTITPPYHNFKTGITEEPNKPFTLKKQGILVLDNLFSVYDKLTPNIPNELQFTIYVETLDCQLDSIGHKIKFCDKRLLRRMIRDVRTRNHGIEPTLTHWHYVRNGELRDIIPFAGLADFWINGSLPYELPIIVNEIRRRGGFPNPDIYLHKNPKHIDAYLRGKRAEKLYNAFKPLDEKDYRPYLSEECLLTEFIG